MRRFLAAGLVALVFVPAAWAWERRAAQQPPATHRAPSQPALPEPEYLSPLARAQLHGRMQRHGALMGDLTRAVVLLEFPRVEALARDVADEPKLARGEGEEQDALSAALAPDFYTYETRLRTHAAALAEAAQAQDPEALGRHFGDLARTCVGCHVAYRTPPTP